MATASSIATRIDEVLAIDKVGKLVCRYYKPAPDNPFAASLFDTLGDNPSGRFTVADLLVLNVLDERLGPPAIRAMVDGYANSQLRAVRTDVDLWDATPEVLTHANALRVRLKGLPGVGATRAAKLCARKRPRLMPIYDTVVGRVLEIGKEAWWESLAAALRDVERRNRIAELGAELDSDPTVLRLLDVAIWMVGSNARSARHARSELGLQARPIF